MRPHLNERSQRELGEIAKSMGYGSVNHALNKLISVKYAEIINAQARFSEVVTNNAGSNKQ